MLPAELRLKVWHFAMVPGMGGTCIVPVLWCPLRQSLYSPRRPPVLLHTCQESREEALKIYQLRFGSSPESAWVYFSYENDILLLNWASQGPPPGRLSKRISDEECRNVKAMMINEEALLLHAEENMHELERFSGLRDLAVLCDSENLQSGREFGASEVQVYAAEHLDPLETQDGDGNMVPIARKERWPEVLCLRDHEGQEPCSRHWWFDGWNQRRTFPQKEKWTTAMAQCLRITKDGPEEVFPARLFLTWLAMMQDEDDSTMGHI